jgi:hypothetical protein
MLGLIDLSDPYFQKWETFGKFARGLWENLSDKNIRQLFDSEAIWRNTKSKGVGRDTILKFLGKNWKWGSLAPTRLTSGSLRNVDENYLENLVLLLQPEINVVE